MCKLKISTILLVVFISATMLYGQVPRQITYQGFLKDSQGNAVTGDVQLTFTIFDIYGNQLWKEIHPNVAVSNGLFNRVLGSINPLNITFNQECRLEVKINNETPLPRTPITGVGYSFFSMKADSTAHIADNSVTSGTIQDGTITASDIGVNVVSSLNGVSNDGGGIDLVAGTNVTITPDDGNNTITIAATPPETPGNTLDQAYDQGGAGAGRTITADAGAVNILGTDGLTVNGTVNATTFIGSGASLTGLNATNLSSGTVDNARLDVDLQDLADGSLTGSKVGTGINASNITTGTISDDRLEATINRTAFNATAEVSATESDKAGYLARDFNPIDIYSNFDYGVYGQVDNDVEGALGYKSTARVIPTPPSTYYGVYGSAPVAANNYAGYFNGTVHVNGAFSKSSGSFKIDHPLEPANKYLYHSFVESPDMMNIYNGVVILDNNGEAWVILPEWFEALNKDFRYQLTAIGAPGPDLFIADEINSNRFRIAGGTSGMKVSWMVTGIRKDAYAKMNPIQVEQEKTGAEYGKYLHPKAFGRPASMGIHYKQNIQHGLGDVRSDSEISKQNLSATKK